MLLFNSIYHRITLMRLVNPPTPKILFLNPGNHQKDVMFSDIPSYENRATGNKNVKN